jgi:hypothetical protein
MTSKKEPAKSRAGRPEFKATDEQRAVVKALAAFGIPYLDIAAKIGVSGPTLSKHFDRELEIGTTDANAKVAQNLFNRACGDGREAVIAAMFWLKCRAGWRENAPIDPPLGKKEMATISAATAGQGTDWGNDLEPSIRH